MSPRVAQRPVRDVIALLTQRRLSETCRGTTVKRGEGLGIAALVMWILPAVAGTYLLIIWLANGGLRQQATKITRFPAVLVLGHPALAIVALATWVEFLFTAQTVYAWSAFGALA